MQAMVLKKIGAALEWTQYPDRQPDHGQIRVKVLACGVCRTDLHVVDGELPNPIIPIIPGHEVVGRIDALGTGVEGLQIGERVGIPWLVGVLTGWLLGWPAVWLAGWLASWLLGWLVG